MKTTEFYSVGNFLYANNCNVTKNSMSDSNAYSLLPKMRPAYQYAHAHTFTHTVLFEASNN